MYTHTIFSLRLQLLIYGFEGGEKRIFYDKSLTALLDVFSNSRENCDVRKLLERSDNKIFNFGWTVQLTDWEKELI